MNRLGDSLSPLAVTSLEEAVALERRHRRLVLTRLVLVTAGALFGALTLQGFIGGQAVDYFGVAGLLAFLGVLLIRQTGAFESNLPERAGRGRAVANVLDSQAWRFAVGARPYVVGEDDRHATADVQAKVKPLRQILVDYGWNSAESDIDDRRALTLRREPLQTRKSAYLEKRIAPLLEAESKSNRSFRSRHRALTSLMLTIEVVGIPAGVVKAIALSNIDLLSVAAACAASLSVWIETVNLGERARASAMLCASLTTAASSLRFVQTEHEWAETIPRVEEKLVLGSEAVLAPDTMRVLFESEPSSTAMTPEGYFAAAAELKHKIWDENPKFEPDIIVGVNPGGAVLGGILYFMTRSDFLPLSLRSGLSTAQLKDIVDGVQWKMRRPDRLAILVVDASIKTGGSLRKALEILRGSLESSGWTSQDALSTHEQPDNPYYTLRVAVIAKQSPVSAGGDPVPVDYYVDETTEKFPYGSI